ncbi:MAG: ABC transporter substrate-binding protein, partial [Rhodoferax sp.]|nr:ABC transporter substrate-binding protein [Rhodoferax sp.]
AGGLAPLYQALMQGHIQGMVIEPFDFPALEEKRIRELSTILEFNDPAVPHGLIMSRKALTAAQQEQWRALINEMRSDGSMRRIFQKYFKPELAATLVNF